LEWGTVVGFKRKQTEEHIKKKEVMLKSTLKVSMELQRLRRKGRAPKKKSLTTQGGKREWC